MVEVEVKVDEEVEVDEEVAMEKEEGDALVETLR